jgi:hypothetical protein
MKLKYKILWVEDEPDSIERPKTQIQRHLEDDYGFECKDEDILIKNYDEFESEFVEEINETKNVKDSIKEFDLLLVDFNLGEDEHTGDKLINLIRDKIYSEILFYSSNLESLNIQLNNHFIDGVFRSDRDHLVDKIKKLIRVTIKKVQDVNNLRGLIMAEVAELDIIKEEIIKLASQKIDEKKLEKYTLDKIKISGNKNKNTAKRYLDDISNITFDSLFETIGFVDSNKKAMTIGEALSKLHIIEPVTKETFTEPYIDNILKKRNKFAHVKECDGVDENGNSCKMIGDIPFTEEKCIEIRKEIKRYKEILKQIEQKLNE